MVALMRGINVGRARRIAMAELRQLLTELGYGGVRTYLQSGNAVFSCTSKAARSADADIEQAIADRLGVRCAVIVRTAEAFAAAVAADPLGGVATDGSRHLLGFLAGDPDPAGIETVMATDHAFDRVEFDGRHVYLWCPNGVLDSPFSKVAWARVLGVEVTMRNWNTVLKVLALTEC
ncbi:MAG TPA: DUF1697 domain-containing protein [Jatrophihabitantaceae bacterium]|jgi:uncharacterized protein (DUF1697 family)|nr:DUF1697 domain-containing protein [Jatrophihabitantaceae bacterium]